MKEKNLLNRILQNTARPTGFWGRIILRGMNRFHAPLVEWAVGMVDWKPTWTVLDVGCGGGANVTSLLKLCYKGTVYGIDISEESVAFARKRNRRWIDTRCFIKQGDVCCLPYDDGQFEAVTAFETIYFWPDISAAFNEVKRVLCSGGIFLISCEASNPDNNVWTSRIEHMRVYTPAELKAYLNDSGFTDISVYQRSKEDLCIIAHRK